ncbi:hypothetical protein RGU70_00540 [Herbaspirillum sp. RTI4]|uniref:hypothetical protein n=1 Tax=Herbaspirillum sp. RTI4 TaxID=3048640 RepID=UPI002AB55074|nr:hypothetical protein [Herbaspirillum sp. RTI4]MDY7576814.1 hypothetical protein [Herbaspirillum sp. RTI4]MEA9981410.1 hypothetical protein [Herbaspirillum sp. RTI4]
MALLPLQAFAVVASSASNGAARVVEAQQQNSLAASARQMSDMAPSDQALSDQQDAPGGMPDDTGEDLSADMSASHAGLDEFALLPSMVFGVPHVVTMVSSSFDDMARQPPFLPPAARPPRA